MSTGADTEGHKLAVKEKVHGQISEEQKCNHNHFIFIRKQESFNHFFQKKKTLNSSISKCFYRTNKISLFVKTVSNVLVLHFPCEKSSLDKHRCILISTVRQNLLY